MKTLPATVIAAFVLLSSPERSLAVTKDSADIALKGQLPPRCTSEITTGTPLIGEDLVLTIWVQHRCNTDSKLVLRVAPISSQPSLQFSATYRGAQQIAEQQGEIAFHISGPIDASSPLVLTIPGMPASEAAAILSSISVDVSPT